MISLLQIRFMVKTGLEQMAAVLPEGIRGKRVGILCHAPSILSDFTHITTHFTDVMIAGWQQFLVPSMVSPDRPRIT